MLLCVSCLIWTKFGESFWAWCLYPFFFRFYWWNIRTLTLVGSFLLVKHSKNRSGLLMAPQVEVILNPGTAATQQLKSVKTLFWVIIFILCSHIFYPCGRSLFQVPQSNLELLNGLIIMWLSGFQPMLTLGPMCWTWISINIFKTPNEGTDFKIMFFHPSSTFPENI